MSAMLPRLFDDSVFDVFDPFADFGRGHNRVFGKHANYTLILGACGALAVLLLAALVLGASAAYYLMFAAVALMFVMAVYYTVKLM